MKLIEYFENENKTKKALNKYNEFISKKYKWNIKYKIGLYNTNIKIYDTNEVFTDRKKYFDIIYEELDNKWSVFRNSRMENNKRKIWDSNKMFSVINEINIPLSINDGKDLTNIDKDDIVNINNIIIKFKDIKINPSGSRSIVAISKFLHFYNPHLFLVLDKDVIKNNVLRIFKEEYNEFKESSNDIIKEIKNIRNEYNSTDNYELPEYFYYMYWASSIIRDKSESIECYKNWLKNFSTNEDQTKCMKNNFAFIFEIIAIGASQLEKESM